MAWQDESSNYVDTMDKELLSRKAQNILRDVVNAGGVGAGVTWVSESGTVVGILGPDGTTVYAQFVRQPDGSVQMQIVPRTGNESTLLSIAGGVGELSSATDTGAVVQLTGTIGGAVVHRAGGRCKVVTVAGSGSVSTVARDWLPDAAEISYTLAAGATVTNIPNIGQLSAGFFAGQRIKLVNNTGLNLATNHFVSFSPSAGGNPADAAFCDAGNYATYEWSGAAWILKTNGLVGNTTLESPQAVSGTGANSLLLGPATAAAGDNSVAMGFEANSPGVSSVAWQEAVSTPVRSFARQGSTRWTDSVNLFTGKNTNTYKANGGLLMMSRRLGTTPATAYELTFSGTTTIDAANILDCTKFIGLLRLNIEVMISVEADPTKFALLHRLAVISSDGTTGVLRSLTTVGTDVYSDVTYMPTIEIAISSSVVSHLKLSSNGTTGSLAQASAAIRYSGAIQ